MKIRILYILLAVIICTTGTSYGQAIVKGSGVLYTNGAPTHTVNVGVDAEIAIDSAAGLWYEYNRDVAAWEKAGFRVRHLSISIAPTGAPTDKQSEIVINDVDSLYQWRAGAWRHLNRGNDPSITNEGTLGVGAGGASSSVLTSNTSGATGVTINVGGINTITETTSANGGSITITATEVDGSTTNELQTYSHAGTTTYTNTLSNGGGSWSITGAGIAVISQTAGAITVTATEVDGSTTNELQTFTNSSNATSHTLTLSNSGGSIQFVEGSNVTITTTGTASDAIVTIAASGGGGSTNYQTWYGDGVAATQQPNANFVSTSDIAFTLTNDGASSETEVTADIPAAAVDFSEIQNVSTGTLAGRSTAGSGSLEQITVSTGLTISGGNLTAVDASATNELQTYSHAGTTTYTNTLSNGGGSWSITGAGIAVISQTAGAITVTATEVDGSTTNELQTYSHAGTTTYTNTLSNGGGSWSITGAGIAVISQTAGAVTVTATEVDGSLTNEGQLGVGAGGATSSVITSNTSGATGVTINVAGINTITETTSSNGGQITITATEVDGSLSNEGSLTVGAGGSNDSQISSNTSGSTAVTISGGSGMLVTESGSTITISPPTGTDGQTLRYNGTGVLIANSQILNNGTEVGIGGTPIAGVELYVAGRGRFDATIESQGTGIPTGGTGAAAVRLINTTPSTGDTWYLGSMNDGTFVLQSGNSSTVLSSETDGTVATTYDFKIGDVTGITPTTVIGRDANGFVGTVAIGSGLSLSGGTLSATGGGGTNYQTWRDDGVAATQQPNANFVSNSDIAFTLTNDGASSETEVAADIPAAAVDFSEIQNVSTGTIAGRSTAGSGSLEQITVSTGLTISGGNLTAVDQTVSNEGQLGVGAGGATSSVITSNTSGATGVTINVAGINTISETTSANGGQITITATEVDGSTTNELQTYSHAGTTTYTNTLSNGGGSWSITGAGIAVISQTAGAITVTATEVDGSITNEGQLGVGAGGASSSVLTSNTSGATGVTINVAGINTISETTSANGGQITITATEVDGSTTNELQTFTNSSNATSHTVTLSNSGGSIQFVEGANITLTTTGTASDAVVTIASTGGGGTPAGASFQVQYNNAGAFGAEANFNYDPTNDQLVVGTGTAAAVIHGRGRNDSGVNVFLAENFSANDILSVKSNGIIKLGDNETYPFLKQTNTAGGAVSYTANGITFESQPTSTTTDVFAFNHPSYGLTTGTHNITRHTGTLSVASGTSIYRALTIDPTINVNTTASGLTDMLNISPTITQATGGVNMVNIVPSITAASGGLRGIRTDIAAATGFYQIYADGTAISRFDGEIGIKTDPASGFDLHVVGNQRNDARLLIRGTGTPPSSSASSAIALFNTSGGSADTWYLGSMSDGTMWLGSGNSSMCQKGQADGTMEFIYDVQLDFLNGTPTKVIGVNNTGVVGQVTLGTDVVLSAGELPLWNSTDAGVVTSLTTTALANVTGLSFDVTAGKEYEFWAAIKYSANNTTTGSAWSIDCPAGTVQLHVESATANNAQFFHAQNAENTLLASASSAYTSGNLAYVRGIFECTTGGTCIIRGATEVASNAISVQGTSNINWREIK